MESKRRLIPTTLSNDKQRRKCVAVGKLMHIGYAFDELALDLLPVTVNHLHLDLAALRLLNLRRCTQAQGYANDVLACDGRRLRSSTVNGQSEEATCFMFSIIKYCRHIDYGQMATDMRHVG